MSVKEKTWAITVNNFVDFFSLAQTSLFSFLLSNTPFSFQHHQSARAGGIVLHNVHNVHWIMIIIKIFANEQTIEEIRKWTFRDSFSWNKLPPFYMKLAKGSPWKWETFTPMLTLKEESQGMTWMESLFFPLSNTLSFKKRKKERKKQSLFLLFFSL